MFVVACRLSKGFSTAGSMANSGLPPALRFSFNRCTSSPRPRVIAASLFDVRQRDIPKTFNDLKTKKAT
jgi:hypothetical protein